MLGWEDPRWHSPAPISFSERRRTFRSHTFRKPEFKFQHMNYMLFYHLVTVSPTSQGVDLIERSPDHLEKGVQNRQVSVSDLELCLISDSQIQERHLHTGVSPVKATKMVKGAQEHDIGGEDERNWV